MSLVRDALKGDPRSVARLISMVEEDDERTRSEFKPLYRQTGSARVIGVTGPAGAGKSTLVNLLARELHRATERIGILAIDPSSPMTGGAVLGDRLRMRDHLSNPRIFIRSLAARRAPGGIAAVLPQAIRILDAAGYQTVIVETVGAGQDEVAIMELAGVVLVVLAPDSGDDIQALKAGLLEIGDLIVLNKSDRPESDSLQDRLLRIGFPPGHLERVSALTGEGVARLAERVESLFQRKDAKEIRRRFCRWELSSLLERCLVRRGMAWIGEERLQRSIERMALQGADPYTLVEELIGGVFVPSLPSGRPTGAPRRRRREGLGPR